LRDEVKQGNAVGDESVLEAVASDMGTIAAQDIKFDGDDEQKRRNQLEHPVLRSTGTAGKAEISQQGVDICIHGTVSSQVQVMTALTIQGGAGDPVAGLHGVLGMWVKRHLPVRFPHHK
jgi:hypothetical protein